MANRKRDGNYVPVIGAESTLDSSVTLSAKIDPVTDRLLVDAITDPTESTDFEGAPVTIGTSAVEVTFTGTTQSIYIQADHDNTGNIWVGKSNIDNAGANAMARLMAGESITIELNDSSNAIYAVSDTASQKIYKMALI